MKKLFLIFALVFSSQTFSDDGISDMKELCNNPGRFHNQNPPSKLTITCKDFRTRWVQTTHEEGEFANHREICTRATADKPGISVPNVCTDCSHFPTGYECPGFKEIEEEAEVQYDATCDEVNAMESVFKFCFDRMNTEVAATDSKILNVKDTGKTVSMCGAKKFENGKPVNSWSKPSVNPTVQPSVGQR